MFVSCQRNPRRRSCSPWPAPQHTAEWRKPSKFTASQRGGRRAQVPQERYLSSSPWPKHFPSSPHMDSSKLHLWEPPSPVRKLKNKGIVYMENALNSAETCISLCRGVHCWKLMPKKGILCFCFPSHHLKLK